MQAGKLRHRLAIHRATETRTARGGVTRTYAAQATRFASIRPLSGRELIEAGQVEPRVTTEITMRYYEGLLPTDRLVFSTSRVTHTYEIVQILDTDLMGRELVIRAVEVPDDV